MITRRIATCGLLALAAGAAGASSAFRPLRSGSFPRLVAARRGEPFLLVLWSITCAPCREEFELLGEMRDHHPGLPLVLISTDDIGDEPTVADALTRFGMAGEESWIFADDAQKLRYEIDPGWYGELPRAYFYAPGHQREGVSGRLSRERIERWLELTGQARGQGAG